MNEESKSSPIVGIAWAIVKPTIEAYLQTRALVIPKAKLDEFAKRIGITPAQAKAYDDLINAEIIAAVDRFKP